MKIKKILKKWIAQKIKSMINLSSEDFVDNLRAQGVLVGKKTKFFNPNSNVIDVTRPWMLKIGDYCKITHGVVILAHDYSRSVVRRSHQKILAEGRNTVIGNNVFIGVNAIILAGAHIGNNVIVGAGAVVSGTVPDNVIVAGNPCRIIKNLDEYIENRQKNNLKEAKNCYIQYKQRYGRKPSISEMGHFFPLYCHSVEELMYESVNLDWSGDEKDEIINSFLNSEHLYNSFDDFCQDVENNI